LILTSARSRAATSARHGRATRRQPVSLAVITEQSNRCSSPASEDKNTTGKRIFREVLLANANQRIYPFAPVNRLNRHQHAHLRRDMDHRSASRQARRRLAQSGEVEPFH